MDPQHVADRVAGTATAGASVLTLGVSIATVNEYLQAGAFLVAIISGLAATLYYLRKLPK
jgi:hypothetical protein